jgi:phenylalanyl-tRNA synthetase alpha subunit
MNKVLETVLKNERPLNKSQIEAAEQMLLSTLNSKEHEIRKEYDDMVAKKYAPLFKKLVDKFNSDVKSVNDKMQKEFCDDISVRISSDYSYSNKVSSVNFSIGANYISPKHPLFALKAEINDIVLGMKLGENLKTEMLEIVKKINTIK